MLNNSLIGISAKIHCGKDTVFSLIQELTSYNWENKKFAYKVKLIVSILTGIQVELLEDDDVKNQQLSEEWNFMTVREMLQKIGTDAIRNQVHLNSWINGLFVDWKPVIQYPQYGITEEGGNIPVGMNVVWPNWVITDLRFQNELEAIKQRNGITLRVERYCFVQNWLNIFKINDLFLTSAQKISKSEMLQYLKQYDFKDKDLFFRKHTHASETDIDDQQFDYVIKNDGSLQDLKDKVKGFLKHFNIINE